MIVEKELPPLLIAGMRMTGGYGDCGNGFSRVSRHFGRYRGGKPLLLCYDRDYQEIANYEVCIPLKRKPDRPTSEEFSVRELPGGRCISLTYVGPYDQMSKPYEAMKAYLAENGQHAVMPSREIYWKGPGMIFRGNPKNYITELQMLLE